ncbi:MAG: DUF1080 domain-containing protein [Rubripirellula sp.]|nr:DUF1080 domain-containing protein [Rubripirellula sp.]
MTKLSIKSVFIMTVAAAFTFLPNVGKSDTTRPHDTQNRISFRIAVDTDEANWNAALLPDGQQTIYVDPESCFDMQQVARAAVVSTDEGRPAISIEFTKTGGEQLEKLTSENTGKRLAILFDGQVIQAPKIVGSIGKRAVIHGNFTIQQAVQIAHTLNGTNRFVPAEDSVVQLGSFTSLFNGKDLAGWTNVNTANDTWFVKDGLLVCKGMPIGVMRSNKQYENFVLHIEWRHMKPGGNSGVFVWSEGSVPSGRQLPKGMEVQMLELDWVNQHPRGGSPNHVGYVSGELFGAGGLNATPDIPRGRRSMSRELRCNGAGQWNTYDVVCVDGTVKLSVNGVFVNSIRESEVRRGYLCLESEGSEIHFRNIQILELPPSLTAPHQAAAVIEPESE